MKYRKTLVMTCGLIAAFAFLRAGEYLVDYCFGDQDGHFSSLLLSSGIALMYGTILIVVIILVTLRIQKLLSSTYPVIAERFPNCSKITFRIGLLLLSIGLYVLQSYVLLVIARELLAFKRVWISWFAVILAVIAPGVILSGSEIGSYRRKQVINVVTMLCISALLTYGSAFGMNLLLYKYGYHLSFLSQTTRDLYYSLGIFDRASHPQYRRPFKAFVASSAKNPSERIVSQFSPGDAYRQYGIPKHSFEVSWPGADALGWANNKTVTEAEVLFLGDSFGGAAGAGFDYSIPVRFGERTGIKTYNASASGYGLPHYLEILRYLTRGTSDNKYRFQGKLVYILLYVGNDLTYDLNIFQQRVAEEQSSKIAFYFRLQAIKNLIYLARSTSTSSPKNSGLKKTEIHQLVKADDVDKIETEKKRTNGWYPHFTELSHYKDSPFAFHPFHKRDFKDLDWLDDEKREYIRSILQAIETLSKELNIQVRFVVLPTKLQIIAPHLKPIPSNESLEFNKLFPSMLKNEDYVYDFIVRQIQAFGFEVLDMKPIFEREILHQPLVWPGDTHYTPEGYQLVTDSIISAFHKPIASRLK